MSREKFATQVDPGILKAVRGLAHDEGRRVQVLVEEALSDYLLEKHRKARAPAPTSWPCISVAMKNSAASTRSWLNDRNYLTLGEVLDPSHKTRSLATQQCRSPASP